MNEPSKTPFEPIPMPGPPAMPAIPEMPDMPAIPEMPRPSFSRSATPPIPRRPLMIEAEKPNPFLLPQGIAPEATPAPLPPAPPAPASGGAMSWLKPSRAKGVVFAGLASLGIGAFGLNALVPTPIHEAPKPGDLADATTAPSTKAPTPKIHEERPPVEAPALLPREIIVQADDPWAKTPAIKLVEGTGPTPIAVPPATIPTVPEPGAGALPVPALTVPEVKPLAVPGLPPVNLDPPPEVKPLPVAAPVLIAPAELPVTPMPTPAVSPVPKPAPLPEPTIAPEPKPTPIVELKPKSDPAPLPLPLTAPVDKAAPSAPVDAKTDYDVDIHKLKAGDTYAIISAKFYGTASYAGALRSYNDGLELARLRDVQVPPMHVIKRFGAGRDATDAPRILPVGVLQDPAMVAPPGIERDIQWGTPGSRKADKPTDGGVNWR